MCAVSVVTDHYGQLGFQKPLGGAGYPPPAIPWPKALPQGLPWTRESMDDLKEILRRLDALDKKLGLEACEDPKKGEWMRAIEARLDRLESARRADRAEV